MTTVLKRTLTLTAAIALLAGCASVNDPQAATTEQSTTKEVASNAVSAKPEPDGTDSAGVICKKRAVTGSRFTKKVCTTAAQREKAKQRGSEIIDKVGGSSVHTNMDGG